MTEQDLERARENAKAGLESIAQMVKRLQHAQECDGGDDCQLTDQEILGGINIFWKEGMTASADDVAQYHNQDAARQAIHEDPLTMDVRSGWYQPGGESQPEEYNILLGTGGPALRVIGDLDEHLMPTSAHLEYQDWFTPWTRYGDTSTEEDEALLEYARQFYYGE